MTIGKVIRLADALKPNAIGREQKYQYINEIEGLVQSEVMLLVSDDIVTYDCDATGADDTVLLVKPPHDKLYIAYLVAMIDYANGEYNKYANTIEQFNTYYAEYHRWYFKHFHPADGECVERGYYLSAYTLAVLHGFEGDEDAFVASMVGKSPEMRYTADGKKLEWKYTDEGDDAWRELIDLGTVTAVRDEAVSAAVTAEENAAIAQQAVTDAQNYAIQAEDFKNGANQNANYALEALSSAYQQAQNAKNYAEQAKESSTLGMTAAKVGDYAKVAEVDENGVPTRFEASEVSGSGMSQTLRVAIYNLLMDAVYQSSGHESDKAALEELLTGESGGEGGGEEVIYYTIEKTLTNVSISNGAASVAAGSAYSATLTADEGYTLDSVTVTMGGEAVTVTDGVIDIAAVTGNIVITATATAEETGGYEWTSGVAYDYTDKIIADTNINDNGHAVTSTGKYCTDYLNCFDVDYLTSKGNGYPLHFYDVNKNYISKAYTSNIYFYPVPENAVYFRSNLPNGDVTTGFTPITKADNNITVGVQTVTWTKGLMTETGEIGSGSMYTTNELIPVAGAIGLGGAIARIACYDAYKNFIYYKSSPTNLNNFKGFGWDAFSYVRVCNWSESTIEVFDENAHTFTKTLSNVTCSYTKSLVNDQHPLNATLTASDGYALSTVTVTMGGVDITESAYAYGTITIDNVTGDIVITATAEAVE